VTTSHEATHAAGHAEIAGDRAESATGAQCIDVAGGALRRMTGGRDELVMVAALFVEADGAYAHLPGVETWTEASTQRSLLGADVRADARLYAGPHVVVAHPPCSTWCQLAKVNEARYGHRVGDDSGCFVSALASVQRWGGVLEHPAYTHAWPRFGLTRPPRGSWGRCLYGSNDGSRRSWVTEVSQSAYGHRARKRTWLYYVGNSPPPKLDWRDVEGDAWCGWNNPDRDKTAARKPTLSKAEAKASPPAFRDLLIALARGART
jgi:hypothetical protein